MKLKKLLVAMAVGLGAASANAAVTCNPDGTCTSDATYQSGFDWVALNNSGTYSVGKAYLTSDVSAGGITNVMNSATSDPKLDAYSKMLELQTYYATRNGTANLTSSTSGGTVSSTVDHANMIKSMTSIYNGLSATDRVQFANMMVAGVNIPADGSEVLNFAMSSITMAVKSSDGKITSKAPFPFAVYGSVNSIVNNDSQLNGGRPTPTFDISLAIKILNDTTLVPSTMTSGSVTYINKVLAFGSSLLDPAKATSYINTTASYLTASDSTNITTLLNAVGLSRDVVLPISTIESLASSLSQSTASDATIQKSTNYLIQLALLAGIDPSTNSTVANAISTALTPAAGTFTAGALTSTNDASTLEFLNKVAIATGNQAVLALYAPINSTVKPVPQELVKAYLNAITNNNYLSATDLAKATSYAVNTSGFYPSDYSAAQLTSIANTITSGVSSGTITSLVNTRGVLDLLVATGSTASTYAEAKSIAMAVAGMGSGVSLAGANLAIDSLVTLSANNHVLTNGQQAGYVAIAGYAGVVLTNAEAQSIATIANGMLAASSSGKPFSTSAAQTAGVFNAVNTLGASIDATTKATFINALDNAPVSSLDASQAAALIEAVTITNITLTLPEADIVVKASAIAGAPKTTAQSRVIFNAINVIRGC